MSKMVRDRRTWWAALGLTLAVGVVVSLVVLGSSDQFTATPYADVIRFEARGVASLQVQILDLSGRKLWDSGVHPGSTVDWDRRNEWGERLAYGAYLCNAQGWNARGDVVFQKTRRLALMPGDKVQLQQAPVLPDGQGDGQTAWQDTPTTLHPMAYDHTGDWTVSGSLGVGTDAPAFAIDIQGNASEVNIENTQTTNCTGPFDCRSAFSLRNPGIGKAGFYWYSPYYVTDALREKLRIYTENYGDVIMDHIGNFGIGTVSPVARVDVRNTSSQPALRVESSSGTNLIEAYNTGSGTATGLVFRVERSTGDVRAAGAFYGAGFHTGSADVAEHVNASEVLEPGDVVEIDPDNPQHFRLARTPGSRLVAGVISTAPGVVLGSPTFDSEISTPESRLQTAAQPLLALAGRVPVKVTTENGPIAPGDLLISSSKPGHAMRCGDPASAVGTVIGKALEPLEVGEDLVLVQVALR